MSIPSYTIDPDISNAETLPASFYRDQETFETMKEKVFYRSWQIVGDENQINLPGQVYPTVLLDSFLTEPLVLTRDEQDQIHCLSNVCTHRGNLVAMDPGKRKKLVCAYHGRKFGLDGKFEHMPEFSEAKSFPRDCEDLHQFELEKMGSLVFAKLGDGVDLPETFKEIRKYIDFLPLKDLVFSESQSKDYLVNAHWALYVDNYLEGFHIPFVHPDLNAVLDYGKYDTVVGKYFNLQIGYDGGAEKVFDLPKNHIHHGERIAAYYFWIFPNIMLNFYGWGLSVNIVRPLSPNQTKVSFLTYLWDEALWLSGSNALMDKVEREDEFVVEGVQKGLRSKYYKNGRFSPTREKGVHHFHSLLCEFLAS